MIWTPIVLFLCAALLGLFLLSYVLRDRETPKAIAFLHGTLGALGILALIYLIINSTHKLMASLTLFVLAALGGFYLIYKDLTGNKVPKPIALIHGSVALIAFVFLVYEIFL